MRAQIQFSNSQDTRSFETVIASQRVGAKRRPMTGSAKQSIAPAVIASEAKQSILPRKKRMDCFAALAMRQVQTRFRYLAAPCARAVDKSLAQRGRGERRMPVAPAASCALCIGRKHTSRRVPRNHPAFPHAMVLTVSFVLSPAIGLFCHRRLAD